MLNTSVRTPEDVVSRYGGEEFVVILFDCEESVAEKVAARIQGWPAQRSHSAQRVEGE